MKQDIALMLEKISKELDQYTNASDNHAGLLGGYTGCALFYAYYYQHTSAKEHFNKSLEIIEKSIMALAQQSMNGSFCSGIAGISWCIDHLIGMGFIEAEDVEDVFVDIDKIVGDFLDESIREGKNDFLHEGVGTALYFLRRPHTIARGYLERLVTYLEDTAHTLPTGISWKDNFSSQSEKHKDADLYNLGLAHGVPAIIAILARIHEYGVARETTARLIDDSIKWLLSTQRTNGDKGVSLFPVQTDAQNNPVGVAHSRLGWCYGDLGIATMLLGVSNRLSRKDYKDAAMHIFHEISLHRNRKNGAVHDACICHGSAGIAHILQQAGLATREPVIMEAAEQWLQTTLQMNTWADGPAGYKFYHHPEYLNSHNVLEGIAGIGLSLISFLDPKIKPEWNESLLIS